MEAGVPRPGVEAWKQAWQARRRRGGAGLPTRPPRPRPPHPPRGAFSTSAASAADGRPVLCLDVTLALRHGGRPAVGLVRVEHDIARHLLGLAEAEVLPVLCGPDGRYRLAEAEEIRSPRRHPGRAGTAPAAARDTGWRGEALGDVLRTLGRLAALAPAPSGRILPGVSFADGRLSGWLAAALVGGGVLAGRAAQALLARRGPPAAAPSPRPARPLPAGRCSSPPAASGITWTTARWRARCRAGRLSLVTVLS